MVENVVDDGVTPRFPNNVNNTNNQSIPRKRDITLHSKYK